jgi:hypothetical protein
MNVREVVAVAVVAVGTGILLLASYKAGQKNGVPLLGGTPLQPTLDERIIANGLSTDAIEAVLIA